MKHFLWTLKNIFKIFIWIFWLILLMNYFGTIYGILVFVIFAFFWNIILTLLRYKRLVDKAGAKSIFNTIFSKDAYYLPFIAYGCYCSPKYGVNWATDGFLPIDGLDEACKRHDVAMYLADSKLKDLMINKADHARMKNRGDWRFMKEAMTSKNYANGIYLLGLEIGFLGRLIMRSTKLMFL